MSSGLDLRLRQYPICYARGLVRMISIVNQRFVLTALPNEVDSAIELRESSTASLFFMRKSSEVRPPNPWFTENSQSNQTALPRSVYRRTSTGNNPWQRIPGVLMGQVAK